MQKPPEKKGKEKERKRKLFLSNICNTVKPGNIFFCFQLYSLRFFPRHYNSENEVKTRKKKCLKFECSREMLYFVEKPYQKSSVVRAKKRFWRITLEEEYNISFV